MLVLSMFPLCQRIRDANSLSELLSIIKEQRVETWHHDAWPWRSVIAFDAECLNTWQTHTHTCSEQHLMMAMSRKCTPWTSEVHQMGVPFDWMLHVFSFFISIWYAPCFRTASKRSTRVVWSLLYVLAPKWWMTGRIFWLRFKNHSRETDAQLPKERHRKFWPLQVPTWWYSHLKWSTFPGMIQDNLRFFG